MNHWKHAKKYGVLIVLICAALCFWLSQAQGAEMGSFSGKVFEDLNNDGIMDENDPGVAGVTLEFVFYDVTEQQIEEYTRRFGEIEQFTGQEPELEPHMTILTF